MRKASSAILNSIIEADVYTVIDRPLTAAAERGTTRQGIASQLFRASFAALAAKGCEKVFTFVRTDIPVSLQTYQHHGFRVVGVASLSLPGPRPVRRRDDHREAPALMSIGRDGIIVHAAAE